MGFFFFWYFTVVKYGGKHNNNNNKNNNKSGAEHGAKGNSRPGPRTNVMQGGHFRQKKLKWPDSFRLKDL